MIHALNKLSEHFDLIIYTSLDKQIGDAIIDFIENSLNKGKKLFQ